MVATQNWSSSGNPTTGTTTPIFVPRTLDPKPIRVAHDYFLVQVHAAQAAFRGSIWERVKQLIVASQVSLKLPPPAGEKLSAIQRSRNVQRNRAEQLGMRPTLVELVPTIMPSVSISIDFILDKESRMAALGALINDDNLASVVSLVPGSAEVARAVAGLANKLIQTFLPAQEREPILQFSGDFDFATGQTLEGYYVILGTRDPENPLPNPLPTITVEQGLVKFDGRPVDHLSYVVLEFRRTEARTRALSDGSLWEKKLREAEDEARNAARDLLTTESERDTIREKILRLLKEAQVLLRADPSFLPLEAQSIIGDSWDSCRQSIASNQDQRGIRFAPPTPQLLVDEHLQLLDLPPADELADQLNLYAEQVQSAKQTFLELKT